MASDSRLVLLHAKVPPALKQQLADRARRSERTVSAELRVALRRHLSDESSHVALSQR